MPQGTAGIMPQGLEGGVRHDSRSRYGAPASFYMPHSEVVSRFETARTLRTREKGWDESDPPPKNRGVMRSQKEVRFGTLFSARLTGRYRPHLSLREGSETAHRRGAERRETDL